MKKKSSLQGSRSSTKKGQAAMEYLFIVGFGFVLLIPIILLFYTQTSSIEQEIAAAQLEKSIQEIVGAADTVYYLGVPSKQTIKVRFPEQINSVSFQNNLLIVSINSPEGGYELVGVASVNLTGEIETYAGIHVLLLEATTGFVNITES